MSGDYVPHAESGLVPWGRWFVDCAQAHVGELGIPPAVLDALAVLFEEYVAARRDYLAAQAAVGAACGKKEISRKAFVKLVRTVSQQIQANPNVTDPQRCELRLTVDGGGEWTAPVAESGCRPYAIIDIQARLKHILRVRNETATGSTKARPAGALGCEVWHKVGEPPQDECDMHYAGLLRHNPFVVDYSGEDGGKQVHYMLRWVSTTGEKGPWSNVQSATIAT